MPKWFTCHLCLSPFLVILSKKSKKQQKNLVSISIQPSNCTSLNWQFQQPTLPLLLNVSSIQEVMKRRKNNFIITRSSYHWLKVMHSFEQYQLIKRVKIMYPYLLHAIFKISNSLFVIYSQRLGWFNSKQKNDLNTDMIDQSI